MASDAPRSENFLESMKALRVLWNMLFPGAAEDVNVQLSDLHNYHVPMTSYGDKKFGTQRSDGLGIYFELKPTFDGQPLPKVYLPVR